MIGLDSKIVSPAKKNEPRKDTILLSIILVDVSVNSGTPKTPQNDHF